MCKGMVFNIQKYSIHDGPGIRTTVFLKGCPLRCRWCSNPESQHTQVQLFHDAARCIQDGACIRTCTQQALQLIDKRISINEQLCTGCLRCTTVCNAKALYAQGEFKEVSKVVSYCLQDREFYEESQGGVTLSGGEALLQPEFTKALALQLKQEGIHIAVETTAMFHPLYFNSLPHSLTFCCLISSIMTENSIISVRGYTMIKFFKTFPGLFKGSFAYCHAYLSYRGLMPPYRMRKDWLHCYHHLQLHAYSCFRSISLVRRNMICWIATMK